MKTPFRAAVATMLPLALLLAAGNAPAQPLQCEIDGAPVNPSNGATTAGKTGLMRCRDSDGKLQREQELRDGRFVGMRVFHDRDGSRREGRVNERGNTDGLQREFWPDGSLKREETALDGSIVGVARSFHPGGRPARIAHHAPRQDNVPENAIEFNPAGQVIRLACAPVNRLAETLEACGFSGERDTAIHNARGDLVGRDTWNAGRLTRRVSLRDGRMLASLENTAERRIERSFHPDGTTVRQERESRLDADGRPRSPREGADREFAPGGQKVREVLWSEGLAREEREWFQNGSRKSETVRRPGAAPAQVRQFWDNDKPRLEEERVDQGTRGLGAVVGRQRLYRENGSLAQEWFWNARGIRERLREYDAEGKLTKEEEYFDDGSRKPASR